MGEFDKMLEDVAREGVVNWMIHEQDKRELLITQIASKMKRRLLPLLEAGQAVRETWGLDGSDVVTDYDAKKQAAMEGRCSTDQK